LTPRPRPCRPWPCSWKVRGQPQVRRGSRGGVESDVRILQEVGQRPVMRDEAPASGSSPASARSATPSSARTPPSTSSMGTTTRSSEAAATFSTCRRGGTGRVPQAIAPANATPTTPSGSTATSPPSPSAAATPSATTSANSPAPVRGAAWGRRVQPSSLRHPARAFPRGPTRSASPSRFPNTAVISGPVHLGSRHPSRRGEAVRTPEQPTPWPCRPTPGLPRLRHVDGRGMTSP
jgi:hypothetical protein